MSNETSKSSAASGLLWAAVALLVAFAMYMFVKVSSGEYARSAEQNTLAQAQGPLPPPARLPTPQQAVEQTAPATAQTLEQPAEQAVTQEPPAQEFVPQEQQEAPAQPRVTRLPPAAPNPDSPDTSGRLICEEGSERC